MRLITKLYVLGLLICYVRDEVYMYISSLESQKGVIADQRCSVENQKGIITIGIRHNFRVQIFLRFWTRCGNSRGLNFMILLMFSLL